MEIKLGRVENIHFVITYMCTYTLIRQVCYMLMLRVATCKIYPKIITLAMPPTMWNPCFVSFRKDTL